LHSHIETSNYCILKFQTRVWTNFVLSHCNNCTANEFTNLSLTVYRSGGIVFLQTDKRLYSRRIHYKTDAYGSYIANCLFLLECLGTAWQTGNVITRNEGFERQEENDSSISSFFFTNQLSPMKADTILLSIQDTPVLKEGKKWSRKLTKDLGLLFVWHFSCQSPRTDQNSVGDFYIAFSYIVNLRTLQNVIDVYAITVIHLTICNFAFLFYLLSISYMMDNFLFLILQGREM